MTEKPQNSIENMLLQYAKEKKIQVNTNVWYTGEGLKDYLASGNHFKKANKRNADLRSEVSGSILKR